MFFSLFALAVYDLSVATEIRQRKYVNRNLTKKSENGNLFNESETDTRLFISVAET